MVLTKKRPLLVCLFFIVIFLFSNTLLAEVYKWEDSTGKVHFSDREPKQLAEEIILKPTISKKKAEAAQNRSREFVDRQQRKTDFQREETLKAESEARKQALSRAKKSNYCSKARRELRVLKMGTPVYRADRKGKRTYLEESDRAAEIEQWHKNIHHYCR